MRFFSHFIAFFSISLLPHPQLHPGGITYMSSVRSAMHKFLERESEVTFDKIFNQKIGENFCGKGREQQRFESLNFH